MTENSNQTMQNVVSSCDAFSNNSPSQSDNFRRYSFSKSWIQWINLMDLFPSYSSSWVSVQRISLDGRSVTKIGQAHFQEMDFRKCHYRKSDAQFDIFLLLSSPMSEFFCWQNTSKEFQNCVFQMLGFLYQSKSWRNLNEDSHFKNRLLSCLWISQNQKSTCRPNIYLHVKMKLTNNYGNCIITGYLGERLEF